MPLQSRAKRLKGGLCSFAELSSQTLDPSVTTGKNHQAVKTEGQCAGGLYEKVWEAGGMAIGRTG